MVVILRMVASKPSQELSALLRKATDLHGHFGPFLTLGVRMGLLGLRELKAKKGDTELHVTAMLEYTLPFSCMLDGIQTTTRCTIGNQRLAWRESKEFRIKFQLKNNGREVEVRVNPAIVQELQRKLENTQPTDEIVRQLALEVGSRSEKELFSISHK